jgi:hypothetical protein
MAGKIDVEDGDALSFLARRNISCSGRSITAPGIVIIGQQRANRALRPTA